MSEMPQSYFIPDVRMPFCPGCGHTTNLSHLNKAMQLLALDPLKTVLVTDIGCVGLSDQYFNVHAFHGLHGRSITYATGIKLANPELDVIVLMGDGGCGIGGNHLVNAARRNIDITVLVFNNFNFGMTGGEHSVTTPTGGLTTTTMDGNTELPLDIIGLAGLTGASFAARKTTFDRDLPEVIAQAIRHPGFSIMDIWEFCTAYYSPKNELDKQAMLKISEDHQLPLGILVERNNRSVWKSVKPDREIRPQINLDQRFDLLIDSRREILITGGAGQKIRSAASLLAQAAILSGGYVSQKDDYPITVKTGYSSSEVIISPKIVLFTGMAHPDAALILSPDGLKKDLSLIQKMKPGSLIIADTLLPEFEAPAPVIRLPLEATVREIDRNSIALVGIGAILSRTGWIASEAMDFAIGINQKASYLESSRKAFKAGWDLMTAVPLV